MIDYIISFFLAIIVLLTGHYLAKITKEELAGFFNLFNYSLTIFTSVILFIIMFFFGLDNMMIFILIGIFSIFHPLSILLGRIGLSLAIYFFSSFFLVIYFDLFLLGCTLILGFLIASINYYVRNKDLLLE